MSKKQPIKEGYFDLDRIFKYVVTGFLGSKILDKAAQRHAMKDPVIQKKMKKLHTDLKDMEKRMEKIRAMASNAAKNA